MEWTDAILKEGVLGSIIVAEAMTILWLARNLISSYDKRIEDARLMNDKYATLGEKQNDTMKDLLNITSQSQKANEKAVDILQSLKSQE